MRELLFVSLLLEGFSAIAGIYYLKRNTNDFGNKLLTYFLFLTFTTETIGLIPAIIYYNEALHYLKDTAWYANFWLFNPYLIVSFAFYCFYFGYSLQSKSLKKILNYLVIVYVISSFLILVFSDVLFVSYSMFTMFIGVLLLFLAVSFYYYELLQDEKFIETKKSVRFYISISFLLFNLISLPLWIYFKYFSNTISPEFVRLYQSVFYISNILLYGAYIFAFIYCANGKSNLKLKTVVK
jgi:hypothetical protein